MELSQESITFGKYRGETLPQVLKDRSYCTWLLEQEWFYNNYEYLYNRVKEYQPRTYFLKEIDEGSDFLERYELFNLKKVSDIELPLTNAEKLCYEYYLLLIQNLKDQIYERMENEEENIYDIKAPTRWLQNFEKEYGMPRNEFKTFMSEYDLPNIPYIIERIKKEGGLEYKGARSFLIAKERSENQEAWWEGILKERYGEDVSTQFKYESCIFDMINISTSTIFECKLGLKDFDENQHAKYKLALRKYRIIYLVSKDCVIDMERECLYTSEVDKYETYVLNIPEMKNPSYLDQLIEDFDIVEVSDLSTLFG